MAADRIRIRSVLMRGLRVILIALVVLGIAGAIYEAFAEQADRRLFPPPGRLIDLGRGRRLHLLVTGSETGRPTVILEAGVASFSSNWVRVQQALEAHTRVVSYDRAGLGWSDPPPETHDAAQSAADLYAALQSAGVPGPYVVVGHSYGGLVVRAFADLYPDEVAGIALVDASHPDQWADLPMPGAARLSGMVNRILGALAHVGVVRLFGMNRSLSAGLPERQAAELEAALARPQNWYTSGAVIGIWDSRTAPMIHQARDLGDLPLVVLSAPDRPRVARLGGFADLLDAQQSELVSLSSNSLHLTVEGSTHESLVNEPGHAQAVVEGLLRVVEAAATGKPLAMEDGP